MRSEPATLRVPVVITSSCPPDGGPTSPETTGRQRLIAEAKDDPQFFRDLVWDTDAVIDRVDYLTDGQKAALRAVQPEDLVVGLVAHRELTVLDPFDLTTVCGASCGASCAGSCASTCFGSCGGSCGGSCESSCGATCGGSCGASCGTSCAGSCVTSCVVSGDIAHLGDELVTIPDQLDLTATIQNEIQAVAGGATFTKFNR